MRLVCNLRLELLLLLSVYWTICLFPQEKPDFDQSLESLCTDWIEQNPHGDVEALFQELTDLREHPVNINNAEKEQLEALPFLSLEQRDHLAYFLYRHKPLNSLSELLLCDGMDELSLRRISPFLYVGKALEETRRDNWKSILSQGKHEFRMYAASSFQQKEGLINASDSVLRASGKAFLGLAFSSVIKYQYRYGRQLQYGLVLEQDLGEKAADFRSFHIILTELGKINTAILGDYRLSLGKGLLVSSGFCSGKSSSINTLSGSSKLVSRHFSSSESNYFRGGAVVISVLEHLQVLGFVSCRKLDAVVEDGKFSSIRTNGLHRTLNEIKSKKTVQQFCGGTRMGLSLPFIQCALNAMYYQFNALYSPKVKPYSIHYFRGRNNLNLSFDYRFRWNGALFSGECAVDQNGHMANLYMVQYQAHPLVTFVHLFRYYSPAYNAFFASAFSENTQTRNEAGLFSSMEYNLFERIKLKAYVDNFNFPWLKYGVNAPSSGYDLGFELCSYANQGFEWSLRYKEKSKTENYREDGNKGIQACAANTKRQLRVKLLANVRDLRLKTTADINQFKQEGLDPSLGSMFAQECRFLMPDAGLSFSLQYAMFDTQTYDNRIYVYEQDLPGIFSIPALSGTGSSYVFCCSWKPAQNFKCWLRLKHRAYSDRTQVGSLLDAVQGNCFSEFRLGFQYTYSPKRVLCRQNQH